MDAEQNLPELFYLSLQTEPLGFQATIPLANGEQKRYIFPLAEEGAVELVMCLLAQKSIANALWPKIAAIFQEALRQNEVAEELKPATPELDS